jgi:hypothetical protein
VQHSPDLLITHTNLVWGILCFSQKGVWQMFTFW